MANAFELQVEALTNLGAFDSLHFKARAELGKRLAAIGERYARDVSGSGLAEAGIRSRTGLMGRSIKTMNRTTPAYLKTVVYPTAKDPITSYGYAYALGLGSPRNSTMVRSYVRGSGGTSLRGIRSDLIRQRYENTMRNRGRPGRKLSSKSMTYAKLYKGMTPGQRSSMVEVQAHARGVNLKARPFMGGSAWARIESSFTGEMTDALAAAIEQSQAERAADAAADAAGFEGLGVS